MNRIFTCSILVGLFCIISTSSVHSQQLGSLKFGKVPNEFIQMKEFLADPEADAVIISHVGEAKFSFTSAAGFVINYKIHKVVKVISSEGTSYADFIIPFYNIQGRTDKVFNIKGNVYNVGDDGRIIQDKLTKDNIFEEKVSATYNLMKVSMPKVKPGSVIEISYEINSDLFNYLREWEFQSEIPTIWSEYKLEHPEYFSYSQINQGSLNYDISKKTTSAGRINWMQSDVVHGRYVTSNQSSMQSVDFENQNYHWAVSNVPALREEPFVDNPKSYISKVEFQLKWIQFPNSTRQNVAPSWEKMSEELIADEDFGKVLNKTKFVKTIVPSILKTDDTEEEKINAILNHVSSKVSWNGKRGIYPTKSLEKAYQEGNGSVSEINFILIAFLREAGFNAEPIVSSTRDIGFINPINPLMYKLNYLSAAVLFNGKELVLDASDNMLPFGVSPRHSMNHKGWVVSNQNSHWIDFQSRIPMTEAALIQVSLSDSDINVDVNKRITGFKAGNLKRRLKQEGLEKFKEDFANNLKDWTVIESSFENADVREMPFVEKYKMVSRQGIDISGDFIYLDIFEKFFHADNPFKDEKRLLPIDYIYTRKDNLTLVIDIPDGYEIESLPESIVSNFEDKNLSFSYMSAISGADKIQINCSMLVNQTFYTSDKYDKMKDFFSIMEAKRKEVIVLKRKVTE
ncbi:DUF3857 domain-containing protein [Belliella sp. DSM 111904]|uniref:DUF3857 domain-containing protein n=1 Tax=Belliella filtrata TaxID=2923435 RepID=A0ABS9V0G6_9BACT|nr:DUF3857 domain-containing protein [Belliella filtrata]MCH7409897.1 DUF3857 domain-containing protein [Belliella filtrata]